MYGVIFNYPNIITVILWKSSQLLFTLNEIYIAILVNKNYEMIKQTKLFKILSYLWYIFNYSSENDNFISLITRSINYYPTQIFSLCKVAILVYH